MKKTAPTVLDLERLAHGEKKSRGPVPRDLAKEITKIKKSDDEILRRYPADAMFQQISRKAPKKKGLSMGFILSMMTGPAVAAAMLAVIFVKGPTTPVPVVSDPAHGVSQPRALDGTRLKGLRSHLALYRRTPTGVERLLPGVALKTKEQVQIAFVREPQDQFGIIASVDGRGVTTWHWPEVPGTLGKFQSGSGEVLLGKAYELDDAPAFERFFFFTSKEAFDPMAVKAALENLAQSPGAAQTAQPGAAASTAVNSFLIKKI